MTRQLNVLIDESIRSNPRQIIAGGVIMETSFTESNQQIAELLENLQDAYYLEDTRPLKKLEKSGFHATDDGMEVGALFIRLAATMTGAKLIIETSDLSKRPDISEEDTLCLLELRLTELVMRKYPRAHEIVFHFEQNQSINKMYRPIVEMAAKNTKFAGVATTKIAKKMDPPALALIDYAMYYYSRASAPTAQDWEKRRWAAFRPMVSSIRSLEHGIQLRRGLPDEVR